MNETIRNMKKFHNGKKFPGLGSNSNNYRLTGPKKYDLRRAIT